MREESLQSLESSARPDFAQEPEIGLADMVGWLFANRVRLVRYFVFFCALGLIGYFPWRLSRPRKADGRVVISFKGIEKGEYPNGSKFSIEDLRAPSIVRQALIDVGIPTEKVAAGNLPADISITPAIPTEVLRRWEKQAKDGVKREDYYPNAFDISIELKGLSDEEGSHFLAALMRRYRENVRLEQMTALRLTIDLSKLNAADLLRNNEYGDIPRIMDQGVTLFSDYLDVLIERSNNYSDSNLHFGFSDIKMDLTTWSLTRLETLKAMASRGRLVKEKNTALMRAQYRLEDLDIQVRQRSEEAAQAIKLLEVLPRHQPVLASQKTSRDELPVIDAAVIDRFSGNTYIAPLVKRIMEVQQQMKKLEAEKWRLERDMASLPSAHNVAPEDLPASYVTTVSASLKELQVLISRYNALMDRYMESTVTSLITVEGPVIYRKMPSFRSVICLIAAVSAFLALVLVGLENAFRALASRE